MSKSLIVVESPNKINTIKSYLGDEFEVIATLGHLRELNKKKGYDDNTFEPYWQIVDSRTERTKKNLIDEIKQKAAAVDHIYLATDPDREGEAISWHVYDLLNPADKAKCKRITFNEVTKKAILQSIQEQHEIDMNLVYSQFTRRIFDRIIGYKLSTYVKKMLKASSAGRVQSVALLFVVERELERRAFVPTYWWEINAELETGITLGFIDYYQKYQAYNNSRTSPFKFLLETDANNVYQELGDEFRLESISEPKIVNGDIHTPITTDKLLQLAANNLGWPTSKTTLIAQKMFEGIEFNGEQIGLISYPRTDSERLNDDFLEYCKKFIISNFGSEYYSEIKFKKVKSTVKIQDAHEAIRPVDINITPSMLKTDTKISKDILMLYSLIWTYTLTCLMTPPVFEVRTYMFDNNKHKFSFNHRDLKFKGYKILNQKQDDNGDPKFSPMQIGDVFKSKKIDFEKFEKQPPAYYTEATLIAALKEAGVGRPSTYSSMARIGEVRGYINKEKQKLIPTNIGIDIILSLLKYFPDVISKEFTAKMELDLDKIANGEKDWKAPLLEFNDEFNEQIKLAYEKTEKIEDEKYGEQCPNCQHDLVYKVSKYHKKFVACSNYPTCKYIKPEKKEFKKANKNCPNCGKELLIRQNKKHQDFIGCSGFPACNYIESLTKK